jgi:hypothetical protein
MRSNLAFNFAPAISGEKRLDLGFANGETVIRMSTYVEGLGWSTQKTLKLDEEMLDDLHRVITAARQKIKRESTKETDGSEPSRILQFPAFA